MQCTALRDAYLSSPRLVIHRHAPPASLFSPPADATAGGTPLCVRAMPVSVHGAWRMGFGGGAAPSVCAPESYAHAHRNTPTHAHHTRAHHSHTPHTQPQALQRAWMCRGLKQVPGPDTSSCDVDGAESCEVLHAEPLLLRLTWGTVRAVAAALRGTITQARRR